MKIKGRKMHGPCIWLRLKSIGKQVVKKKGKRDRLLSELVCKNFFLKCDYGKFQIFFLKIGEILGFVVVMDYFVNLRTVYALFRI